MLGSLDSGHATSLFNLADLYRQQQDCARATRYFSLCLARPDCLQEAWQLSRQCDGAAPPPGPVHHHQQDRLTVLGPGLDRCRANGSNIGHCSRE